MLRQAASAEGMGEEIVSELDALKNARAEIAALRSSILEVGRDSLEIASTLAVIHASHRCNVAASAC